MIPARQRVLFGAAYYHEYQPSPRLDTDLDLMAAAGFSVIRVGESVWTTWEPEEGQFDLDWLAPVLDGANRARHRSHPRHADVRRSAVVRPPLPGDSGRAQDRATDALGQSARDRLHPPGVQVLRRTSRPQDHLPVCRPPSRYRLPGRQ